jgi:hypothetical protein
MSAIWGKSGSGGLAAMSQFDPEETRLSIYDEGSMVIVAKAFESTDKNESTTEEH